MFQHHRGELSLKLFILILHILDFSAQCVSFNLSCLICKNPDLFKFTGSFQAMLRSQPFFAQRLVCLFWNFASLELDEQQIVRAIFIKFRNLFCSWIGTFFVFFSKKGTRNLFCRYSLSVGAEAIFILFLLPCS